MSVKLKYEGLRPLDIMIWKVPCTRFQHAFRLIFKQPFPYTHGVLYLGQVVQTVPLWFFPDISVTVSSLPSSVETGEGLTVVRPRGTIMEGVTEVNLLKKALDMATDGLEFHPGGIVAQRVNAIHTLWATVYSEMAQVREAPDSWESLLEAPYSEVISQ